MMVVRVIMNIIYSFIKLCPIKKRITLISRIKDNLTLDIKLLKQILNDKTDYEIVVLNKRLEKGFKNKIVYILFIFKKMYYLATSEVVVIDSYIISVSLLKHKKKTKIIQMWHALGAFKQFGYSIIDKKEGTNYKLAKKMSMHENYDIVVCSSKYCIQFYSGAFNIKSDSLKICLLPRVKYLLNNQEELKNKILEDCLIANGKKNILYAPTFRKDGTDFYEEVIKNFDYKNYNLIILKHGGTEEVYINKQKIYSAKDKFNITWLTVSDYVITDYSAIMYEAMLLDIKLYFYIPDFENYNNNRGFYLDYFNEIPGFYSKQINEILIAIKKNITYEKKYEETKNKYIDLTANSVDDEILKIVGGKYE